MTQHRKPKTIRTPRPLNRFEQRATAAWHIENLQRIAQLDAQVQRLGGGAVFSAYARARQEAESV